VIRLNPSRARYSVLLTVEIGLTVLLGVISVAGLIDPTKIPDPLLMQAVTWLKTTARFTNPVIAGLWFVVDRSRKRAGAPTVWAAVKECLDKLRDDVFPAETEFEYEHRVTLFRLERRWKWRLPPKRIRVLVPILRSGFTTQIASTVYSVDTEEKCEGVVGRTIASNKVVIINNLDDVGPNSDPEQIKKYARVTNVSEPHLMDWMNRHERRLPLSFCGMPLEVKNSPWGVVLLDSREPQAVSVKKRKLYELAGWLVGTLIERGGS